MIRNLGIILTVLGFGLVTFNLVQHQLRVKRLEGIQPEFDLETGDNQKFQVNCLFFGIGLVLLSVGIGLLASSIGG